MIAPSTLVSLIIYGSFLGLMFALMAIGVSIIFGLMKLINFAHGEMYMLGGYAIYYATTLLGLNPFLAIPLSFLTGFFVGQVIEVLVIRPTYTTRMARPDDYAIVTTFGISLFLQNFALYVFGFEYRSPPSFWNAVVSVGNITVSGDVIVVTIVGATMLTALFLFINRTWYDLALRCTAQNLEGAHRSSG